MNKTRTPSIKSGLRFGRAARIMPSVMETILVTGGAGFIGSHTSERLLAAGKRVVCVDNFDEFYPVEVKRANIADCLRNPGYSLVVGDIRDEKLMAAAVKDNEVEAIIHLAARAGVRPSIEQPILYQDVNIGGTVSVLEAARKAGVKTVLFASSSSVYGGNTKLPFSEDDPVDHQVSPYGATKKAGELLCYVYHHLYGLNITCLRYFTVFGPRQRPDLAIHKFVKAMLAGETIPMFGDGSSGRDYTFIDDIVDGLMAALAKSYPYEIINLGGSHPVSLKELIETIERVLGRKAEIEQLPEQPGDMRYTYADVSKAERLLGYKPKVGIEEGIRRFAEWYKSRQV